MHHTDDTPQQAIAADGDRRGFRSDRRWREHPEHLETQARGRGDWYRRFTLRVARVFRETRFDTDDDRTA